MSRRRIVPLVVFVFLLLAIFAPETFSASGRVVSGKSYELSDGSDYSILNKFPKNSLCYGSSSVGALTLRGVLPGSSEYNGVLAFGATSELVLSYSYNGTFQDKENGWYIEQSNAKEVANVSLEKSVGVGAIIVQKSQDGAVWDEPSYVERNIFEKKSTGLTKFFTISESDVRDGCYYRVLVAYRMARNTGEEKVVAFVKKDTFEYREFLEVYEFYVGYNRNPVRLLDIESGEDVSSSSTVSKGFIVDTGETSVKVAVCQDSGSTRYASNLDRFIEPGSYKITITTELGRTFSYSIKITDGMKMTTVSPKIYDGGKNGEYSEGDPTVSRTAFGLSTLTTLHIAQQHNTQMTKSVHNGVDAYGVGITSKSVGLYLKIKDFSTGKSNGWKIVSDTWGKKDKQNVWGAYVGVVGTGTLVVQTSTDGKKWENAEKGAYAKGLYTTDYYSHYGKSGDVLIYTPSGVSIQEGVYIRVIYAYQVKQNDSKNEKRYTEVYELYLCSNNLGAVTFHNLTVCDHLDEYLDMETVGDASVCMGDSETIYKESETLLSGSGTTTGFEIDTDANPTVDVKVYRNGSRIYIPQNKRFTTPGKYEIRLTSDVGDEKTVVIYVDTQSAGEALEKYFGNGFIEGKRIYSEGEYPVFEAGSTVAFLNPVDENYLPLRGAIQNTTLGTNEELIATDSAVTYKIDAPGQYVATFSTQTVIDGTALPGDYRVFTFRFDVIAKGTAPGPMKNQQILAEYASKTATDSFPKYYGLTYMSASSGRITLAFASREAAVEYAYRDQSNTVEQQSDGTFRYTGSYILEQKEKYNSAWDLTTAMYYFADQAVQEGYFDLSVPFTYRDLSDEVIDAHENLRTLELAQSVVLFAPGEKSKLCDVDGLPIISDKPYLHLEPGKNGTEDAGVYSLKFVKDERGYDSHSIVIIDANRKEYPIEYENSVGEQLARAECPSGIVTIKERTIYGDEVMYEAVYIAEGDVTAEMTVTYLLDGVEMEQTFAADDDGIHVNADVFAVSSIVDELDSCSFVVVEKPFGNPTYFIPGQTATVAWSDPGHYLVKVVNRLGYSYEINVNVNDTGYATIAFEGIGTEHEETIVASYGMQKVALPSLTRYGYNLAGFTDESNTLYKDEIAEIMFTGTKVLNAVWEAKQFTLYYKDHKNNDIIEPQTIEFGMKYSLPTPQLDENTKFMGWSIDGTVFNDLEIKVDAEGDLYLVAQLETISNNDSSTILVDDKADGQGGHRLVIACVAVIVFVVAVTMVLKKTGVWALNQNKFFGGWFLRTRMSKEAKNETTNND